MILAAAGVSMGIRCQLAHRSVAVSLKFTAATPETGFGEPKEYPKATQPATPVRFMLLRSF